MSVIKVSREIKLRHVEPADAQILFEIETDKDNIKNMMTHAESIEEVRKSIKEFIDEYKKTNPHEEFFIIEFSGEPAGYVTLHGLNQSHLEHKGQISYALHPRFRNKGITTKAVKAATKYALKKYKLERMEARCRTFNKASARVLEKAGYVLEGIHRKDLKKGKKYLDNMYFAFVK